MLKNQEIRNIAKMKGVYLWEIAERLNMSEPSMTRKLRRELSDQDKAHVLTVIDEIAAAKQTQ